MFLLNYNDKFTKKVFGWIDFLLKFTLYSSPYPNLYFWGFCPNN